MSTAFGYIPNSLVNGVITSVKWKDFTIEDSTGSSFLDGYTIFVTGTVPPNTDATLTLYFGAVSAAEDVVNNSSSDPVPIGVSKSVSVDADGKGFSFIGLDGNPHTGIFPAGGFWADGFSLLASVSPSGPLQIDQYYLPFSGVDPGTFIGPTPPAAPSNLSGSYDQPNELVTLTWDDNDNDAIALGTIIEVSIFDGINSTLFADIGSVLSQAGAPPIPALFEITAGHIVGAPFGVVGNVEQQIRSGVALGTILPKASYDVYFRVASFRSLSNPDTGNPATNDPGTSSYSNEWFFTFNISLTITSIFLPQGGISGGDLVSIHGSGFNNLTDITFGGVSATNISILNDTLVDCRTPAHANGFVDVVVSTLETYATLTNGFEYQSFMWTIQNPTTPVAPESQVIVTSPVVDGLNFSHVSGAYLQYTDSNGDTKDIPIISFLNYSLPYPLYPNTPFLADSASYVHFDYAPFSVNNIHYPFAPYVYIPVVAQLANYFEFKTPNFIPDNPTNEYELFVTGDGTQFSGSISLGILDVLYSDGSGIYKIVKNKTSDTIYDRNVSSTAEVKIPNPFAETGYIGG